jgi:hypothetical protein
MDQPLEVTRQKCEVTSGRRYPNLLVRVPIQLLAIAGAMGKFDELLKKLI